MTRFEPGRTYGVLHMHDTPERVTIASRDASTVTLTDGRRSRILAGMAPDGGDEEVLRLNESGAVALGGVVRASDVRVELCPPSSAASGSAATPG